jgi:hypothetical protein
MALTDRSNTAVDVTERGMPTKATAEAGEVPKKRVARFQPIL